MDWSEEPTARIHGGPGGRGEGRLQPHLHARVWVRLEVWDTALEDHLRLVQSLAAARAGEPWRRVDVAGFPFRRVPDGPGLPPDAGDLLEAALARVRLTVHRSPDLGMVSRPGESLPSFRARVLAAVAPGVRRGLGGETPEGGRDGLTRIVSRLATSIESVTRELVPEDVLQARLGILLVPEGLELPAPSAPDPMVTGGVTGSRR